MIATKTERISKLLTPEPQASAALASSREAREVRKRVWALAGPVIGENFLEMLLGIVETLLVAGLVALFIGSGVLRGAGDARTPLRVTALANLLNVVLAYGLISGHFGLPALGPVGSAWATFIARGLALALLLGALWRGKGGVTLRAG